MRNLILGLGLVLNYGSMAYANPYAIVTQENCSVASDKVHFNCTFPRITLNEGRSEFHPLPYESVVTVKPSRECKLVARDGALKIRMTRPGRRSENFLRYEDFGLSYYRRKVLTDPRSYPLGKISIYPEVADIYKSIRFPPGCTISVSVEMNRVALRTEDKAHAHLLKLDRKLAALKRTHEGLMGLNAANERFSLISGGIAALRSFFYGRPYVQDSRINELRQRWSILKEVITELNQGQSQSEAVDDLTDQIVEFSASVNDLMASDEIAPAGVVELFERPLIENRNAFVPDQSHLDELATEIRNFEARIQSARNYLQAQFQNGGENRLLDQDLADALEELIESPHGILDELNFRLNTIEK